MHEPCAPLLITGTLPRNMAFAHALGSGGQVVADAGHAHGVRMRDYGALSTRRAPPSPTTRVTSVDTV